jgi:hypothetical protein
MNELTTTEAAALLTERGVVARDGSPYNPETVKRQCGYGVFPGARRVTAGVPGRGYWLIPLASVEDYATRQQSRKRISAEPSSTTPDTPTSC